MQSMTVSGDGSTDFMHEVAFWGYGRNVEFSPGAMTYVTELHIFTNLVLGRYAM